MRDRSASGARGAPASAARDATGDRWSAGGRERIDELLAEARARVDRFLGTRPERLIVVSVADQRLLVFEGDRLAGEYRVSTAARGIGGADGSLCTPPGTHVVHERIGAGCGAGAVFESREPTGAVWRGERIDDDLILTRILTLAGREPGVNCGPGCDSLRRTIYIHGTNHEDRLGTPASHGCIRLANRDVVELHERVREGDAVVIL